MKIELKNRINDSLTKHLGVRIKTASPFPASDAYRSIRELRSWEPGDIILDVGANDGRTTDILLHFFPQPQVHSFEPVASTFEKLTERVRGKDNIHCHRMGLGAEAGEKEIFLQRRAILNSFSRDWGEPVGTETVVVSTVDRVMAEQQIDYVHLLKIDTEGYELQVLQGAEEMLRASRIGIICAEVGMNPKVSPHTPLRDLIDFLAPLGYHLHGIFNQHRKDARVPDACRPYEGERFRPTVVGYGDAVFVRADLSHIVPRH